MAQPASRQFSAVRILLTPACMDPGETSTDLSPRWSHHFACGDPVRKQVVSSSFATRAAEASRRCTTARSGVATPLRSFREATGFRWASGWKCGCRRILGLLRDLPELLLHRLWKAHADEILTWEEVILTGFIDNAYQSVFRRELVVKHGVELSQFERGRIVLVADADGEVLRRLGRSVRARRGFCRNSPTGRRPAS